MTTPLAPGNLVQLRVWTRMVASFQAGVNSAWYVVSTVGGSPATDTDVAATLDAQLAAPYKAALNNSADYRGCQAIIHSATPPYPATALPGFSITGAGAGTGGAVPMPKQTCGIIRFQTDRPGPSGRGRWYTAFPPQAGDSGGGTVAAAYATLLQAIATPASAGYSISVGGRTALIVRVLVHGKNKAGIYPPPDGVTATAIDPYWATQKRRGSFGRFNFSPI